MNILMVFRLISIVLLIITLIMSPGIAFTETSLQASAIENIKSKNSVKLAFGSCINNPVSSIWTSIIEKKPDFFLLLGDNLYLQNPEWTSIDKVRSRYATHFSEPGLKQLITSIPTFAIWDDHDFGPNDSDSSFPYRGVTLQAFREQWSNPPAPEGLEESVAFKLDFDWFEILMTDDRSFRVNPTSARLGTYFGKKQLDWIVRELNSPEKQLIIIAGGNQMLGQVGSTESMRVYSAEYDRFLEAIRHSPSKVMIMSGDLHLGQILERDLGGRKIIEVTSSALTAAPSNSRVNLTDPSNRGVYSGANNFGLIELNRTETGVSIHASVNDKNGIAVVEIDG